VECGYQPTCLIGTVLGNSSAKQQACSFAAGDKIQDRTWPETRALLQAHQFPLPFAAAAETTKIESEEIRV
jgi:hypothetical protein